MPLDWTISHDERLVTLKSEGALRYDEIERYLACVSAEGAMPYRKLFDARGGRSELNEQQMMSYAGACQAIPSEILWAPTRSSSAQTADAPTNLCSAC